MGKLIQEGISVVPDFGREDVLKIFSLRERVCSKIVMWSDQVSLSSVQGKVGLVESAADLTHRRYLTGHAWRCKRYSILSLFAFYNDKPGKVYVVMEVLKSCAKDYVFDPQK